MAALERHLRRLIATEGPITIARYMAECLMHPEHGYYRHRDPLGTAGDFITAPEVSQMFGELIGLWLADRWQAMGAPAPVRLVELGPGRGTLMTDALRAARIVPGLADAIDLHLVEANARLRAEQARRLDATWHDRFADVPDGPLLLVANEFFDALPVHQFVRTPAGWAERVVAVSDDRLGAALAPAGAKAVLIPPSVRNAREAATVEVSPSGVALAGDIAARVVAGGGAALIVDYGHAVSAPGDTLQAVRRHAYADVFADPGEADLTAHVDFAQLAEAARAAGAVTAGPVPQGTFLRALGIEVRAARLATAADPAQRAGIEQAVARLTDADQMGALFKVMAILPPDSHTPPGFEEPVHG